MFDELGNQISNLAKITYKNSELVRKSTSSTGISLTGPSLAITQYNCLAKVNESSFREKETGVTYSLVNIHILASSLPRNVTPNKGDNIIIEGDKYTINRITTHTSNAIYICNVN